MNIKYTENGEKVIVIKETDEYIIGKYVYESFVGDGLCIESELCIIKQKLYNNLPVKKKNEQIKQLQKDIDNLTNIKNNLLKEINDINKKENELFEKCKKYEQLRNLRLFIDGKIKYYVKYEWGEIEIVKIEDEKCDYDKKDLKLLCLFGNSKGDLFWKINRYSDHSGSWEIIIPCKDYDDALNEAQKLVDEQIKESIKEGYIRSHLIESVDKYKLNISDDFRNKCKEQKRKELNEQRIKLLEDQQEIMDKIEEIDEEINK